MLIQNSPLTYNLNSDNACTSIGMSHYPNILTPPSSNEESPQPMFVSSPNSSSSFSDSYILPPVVNFRQRTTAPYIRIMEQPIDRFRFRYKSEMTGTHGSLCGINSDKQRKQTYPTIELCNFDKPAVIRCSIYQTRTNEDFKPHAHRLVKKQGKEEVDDPHDAIINPRESSVHTFHSMGIIHTAKKNLVPELVKKKMKLKKEDVARREGAHRELNTKELVEIKALAEMESKSMNLNVVCLRFDAFYAQNGILTPICDPVYTHSINNLKSALTGELKIVRMDHCTSPAKGGREIFILVERVTKKNIKVRFYELDDDETVLWEDYGKFSDLDVHHQYAIVFKTPPYRDVNISTQVKVYIELERPSDRARSEPKEFTYSPSHDMYRPGAKRSRPSYDTSSYDSSVASEELPATINNLSINNDMLNQMLVEPDLQVNSTELQQALTNINSDEFLRIFHEFREQSLDMDQSMNQTTNESVTTDAITGIRRQILPSMVPMLHKSPRLLPRHDVNPKTVTAEENASAKYTVQQLRNFIKTRPSEDSAVISMLEHYFSQDMRTNALHTSIKLNDLPSVMFLLKLLYAYKQNRILNLKNDDCETALHIATLCNNVEIINNLLLCNADAAIGDHSMNTVLHLAVEHNVLINILERLLHVENISKFIDEENNEGNTALNLAIEHNNMTALKLLCMNGVDINKRHKKSGYTPLRFAVENRNVDMVKYILDHNDIDAQIEDFQGINPFQAATKEDTKDGLIEVISRYAREHNCEVFIKHEVEDSDEEPMDDESMGEEKFVMKLEQVTPEELKEMYSRVNNFTPECLDAVATILDRSGTYQNLAELLDLGHLMRSGLCDPSMMSPSKFLLKMAIETNGDTVLQIRDFLENLDELLAVEIIDTMVKVHLS